MNYDNLKEIIQTSLRMMDPLSVIRYGDGESMVLRGGADADFVFNRQLGGANALEQSEIKYHLIDAYQRADIIGLPTLRHLEGPWKNVLQPLVEHRGSLPIMTCSIDYHVDFLQNGAFDELLTGRDELYVITCREDVPEALKKKYGIGKVHAFIIPPELKFELSYSGPRHYPDVFKAVLNWIGYFGDLRGKLCLIGAGVVGKYYNKKFAMAGGVSLDIGCVFDLWAGLKTRGEGRGAGVKEDTYKL